ncbi:DUF3173 domain-containing protein [Leuconostoc mesenteroides]
MNNLNMISKNELINMGFKPHQAETIIRQAKILMVNDGYGYYNNKRVAVAPRSKVEKIIGVPLSAEE